MKEQRNITLAGETISYTLERKAVKNINMRLRPETGLLVSAPMHVPSERVEQILQQHAAKILQTLHQYAAAAEKPKQYPVHYTAGEPVLYLGKSCRLAVERGSRESVLVQGETLRLLVKQPENEQIRKQVFDSWWEMPAKRQCGISAVQFIPCLKRKVWHFLRSGSGIWFPSGATAVLPAAY